jgi:hypothetical protein
LKKEKKGMSKAREKKTTYVNCFNMGHNAIMKSNKVDDQTTLPKKKTRRSKRKCYGCNEKGHEIGSCPNKKSKGFMSSRKRLISKVASKSKKRRPTRTRATYATLVKERDT